MRAAIQTGIRAIEVRELALPERPEGWALIRPIASGICGSDLHPYHGRATPQTLPEGYAGPANVGDLVALDTICLGIACGTCAFCRAGQQFHCPTRQTAPRTG